MESRYVAALVIIIYSNTAIWKHKNIAHLRKCIRKKKEKEKVRIETDLTAILDCYNLVSLGQSDESSLDLLGVGKKARETQSPMGSNALRLGGNAQVPDLGGAFSPLVEGLRNGSGGTLGVFDGLWHRLRHDSCLSHSAVEPGMPHQEGWKPSGPFLGTRWGGSFTVE